MCDFTCGFIGLGLIGGSIAKAIKAAHPGARIIAYDINPESLSLAVLEQVVDQALSGITVEFARCDYLFLCAPVSCNDENLHTLKEILPTSCILTDVGSVKGSTQAHVAEAGLDHLFIGGHPMAGSERIGYANSKAQLLENAYYVLTPSETVSPEKVDAMQALVRSMNAIPLVLSGKEHDYVTAGISHLPHLIAAALVNLVRDKDSQEGIMKQIAAGGFKDITRIASSSPVMWQQICLTNTENISELLDSYIQALSSIKETLDAKDAEGLYDFFDTARTYRESFTAANAGPIKRVYELTVEIADKPGALASIVSLLAEQNISIKNIGITHNREAAEGAMRIEFYEEASIQKAEELLTKRGYLIQTRKL